MSELDGQIAVVTGASRGIGRAIAMELSAAGARVVGTATGEAGLAAIVETGIPVALQLDVTNSESVSGFLDALKAQELDPDILVNNAGVTRDNLLMRMKEEEWDTVIGANLTSLYRLIKPLLRGMMKKRCGRIINIASVVGLSGNAGQANYAASKAGMIGFTKSLAQEVGSRGITVNAVAPGFIATDMTDAIADEARQALLGQIPLGRLGEAREVAAAVRFLASPQAAYITGETLSVNGGMYMA